LFPSLVCYCWIRGRKQREKGIEKESSCNTLKGIIVFFDILYHAEGRRGSNCRLVAIFSKKVLLLLASLQKFAAINVRKNRTRENRKTKGKK
jgi:hypothetical protein